MRAREALALFNRGRVSRLALARTDVSRVALAAEVQSNWMPRRMGSMMLRPGLAYVGTSVAGTYLPFVYGTEDKAILELGESLLRVWDQGDTLLTRPTHSSEVENPFFSVDVAGWDGDDEPGASSGWAEGGFMILRGTGWNEARRRQRMLIAGPSRGILHALRIIVDRGPVTLRIGTEAGLEDVVAGTTLGTGEHSIAFVPTSHVWVEFASPAKYGALISRCRFEPGGTFALPHPWATIGQRRRLRWQQINDVIFCACEGLPTKKIERRDNGSWSMVDYEPIDGPYLGENTERIQIAASDISGTVTLTATQRIFRVGNIGSLFAIDSVGQKVRSSLNGDNQFSNAVRVVGVGDSRAFRVTITGTWAGTISLQRSIGADTAWIDTDHTWTANVADLSINDDLDNAEVFYRIGFNVDEHTSGTAIVTIQFDGGSIRGVVRVTEFSTQRVVQAVVLKDLGGTAPSEAWAEGAWSGRRGYPSAVSFYEGRLWWLGGGRARGSVSDAYDSFDPRYEGDAGPVDRQVGNSSAINWTIAGQRLLVGSDTAEWSVRATSFDEPITQLNYNCKAASTYGSAPIAAVLDDRRAIFVDRTGIGLFELDFDLGQNDYTPLDLTALCPEICEPGVLRLAVQRRPDTRYHCVRTDGTVAVLIRDKLEDVLGWVDVETDGHVVDVCVLPGQYEDEVYYLVRRTVGGVEVYYHERWAMESECRGGEINRCSDSHVVYQGPRTATITGLSHLNGREVVIWGDGQDMGRATVAGGQITLPWPASKVVAGLYYRARYKSARRVVQTQLGSSLTQRARIDHLGLIMADADWQSLRFGPNFETMDPLPIDSELGIELLTGQDTVPLLGGDGQNLLASEGSNTVFDTYDDDMIEFPGEWLPDTRICLESEAPKSCTIMAAVVNIVIEDKAA